MPTLLIQVRTDCSGVKNTDYYHYNVREGGREGGSQSGQSNGGKFGACSLRERREVG